MTYSDLRQVVESYLQDLTFDVPEGAEGLAEAMRYSLLSPGKRVRPTLCLASADSLGLELSRVLPVAAALEMIHAFSLIHDDLPALDDDQLRRGRPTCHVHFGVDVAILAGDALFAEAFNFASAPGIGPASAQLKVVSELAEATGLSGMVSGQYLDVRGLEGDEGRLELTHRKKTGALIVASVVCPAILAQVESATEDAYRCFGEELGLLFQIVNDILDTTDRSELGRAPGSDQRLGRRTYVSHYGLGRARRLARETHANACDASSNIAGDTAALQAIADSILARADGPGATYQLS